MSTERPSPEFGDLAAILHAVQRRLGAATFLDGLTKAIVWALGVLILAGVMLPMRGIIALALVGGLGVLAVAAVATWRSYPSAYQSACRVDAAAGLQDRLSTAWHFADEREPGDMLRRQRLDALARVGEANPAALFPLRWPRHLGRVALFGVTLAALLVYRSTHRAPLVVAVERAAPALAARAAEVVRKVTPFHYEPEQSARSEAMAVDPSELAQDGGILPTFKKEGKGSRSSARGGGPSPFGDEDPTDSDIPQEEDPFSEPEQPQMMSGAGGGQGSPKSSAGEPKGDAQPDQGGQQGDAGGSQSLSDRLRQALSDIIAKARGDQSKDAQARGNSGGQNNPSQPPADAKAIPAPPGGQQSPAQPSPKDGPGDSQDGSPGATMGVNEPGGGDTPGTSRNQQPRPVDLTQEPAMETHPRQEVVPLGLTSFKGQASLLTTSQRGTAQTPMRAGATTSASSTRGSEQGEVPLRYRAYLQDYFTHPEEVRR